MAPERADPLESGVLVSPKQSQIVCHAAAAAALKGHHAYDAHESPQAAQWCVEQQTTEWRMTMVTTSPARHQKPKHPWLDLVHSRHLCHGLCLNNGGDRWCRVALQPIQDHHRPRAMGDRGAALEVRSSDAFFSATLQTGNLYTSLPSPDILAVPGS